MSRLALTIGDPQGNGPQTVAKTLQSLDQLGTSSLAVIGHLDTLMHAASAIGAALPNDPRVTYHDIAHNNPGIAVYQSAELAVELIAAQNADALITGPISKSRLQAAGHDYADQAELLESIARRVYIDQKIRAEMLLCSKNLRLLPLTRHIATNAVPHALSQSGAIARPIRTLIKHLRHQLAIDEARIAILALDPADSPPSKEVEKNNLMPVIHAVNAIGATQLEGCFPCESFFQTFSPKTTPYHAIVTADDDQALFAFKKYATQKSFTSIIGLPFTAISTCPQGTVDSLTAALDQALSLTNKA